MEKNSASSAGPLEAGSRLLGGRIVLTELVDKGNFAYVWKARHQILDEDVIVRVMRSRVAGTPLWKESFLNGDFWMNRLKHPSIPEVYESACFENGHYFMVMEYLRGGTLEQRVEEGDDPVESLLNGVIQIGEALELLHEQGLIHCDVKPANIIMNARGRAVLTDFDTIRDFQSGGKPFMSGSFGYGAPEVMKRREYGSPAADVFGLAMVTLFVLHGKSPGWEAHYDMEGFIYRLPLLNMFKNMLMKATVHNPEDRTQTVASYLAALREVLEHPVMQPRSEGTVRAEKPAPLFWIPMKAGSFSMGTKGKKRVVKLTRSYQMASIPVTWGRYRAFMDAGGYANSRWWCKRGWGWRCQGEWRGPEDWGLQFSGTNQPVTGISFFEASAYCRWLTAVKRDELPKDDMFSLPTGAEWEYAARRGHVGPYPWGDGKPEAHRANYRGAGPGATSTVDAFPKGATVDGLLDMAGNVWEWCWDGPVTGKGGDGENPFVHPGNALLCMLRGGCWNSSKRELDVGFYVSYRPFVRLRWFGFRVVRVSKDARPEGGQ